MPIGEQLVKARIARKMTTSEIASATKMKVQMVEALEHEDFDQIAAPIYGRGFLRLYAKCVGLDPKPIIDEYMMRFVLPPPSPVFDDEQQEPELNTASNRKMFFGRKRSAHNDNEQDAPDILTQEPEKVPSVRIPSSPTSSKSNADDIFSGVNVRDAADFQQEKNTPSESIFPIEEIAHKIMTLFRNISKQLSIQPTQTNIGLKAMFLNMTPLRLVSTLLIIIIILIVFGSAFSKCIHKPDSDLPLSPKIEKDLNIAIEPPDTYLD